MARSYTVKTATIDDLEFLIDQWVELVESQRAVGAHIEGEANRGTARDILAQYLAGDRVAIAKPDPDPDDPHAEDSDSEDTIHARPILGFVMYYVEEGVYEMDTDRGIVENIYVVPEARDQGVGSALMDHAESTLAKRGAAIVALSVMAANERGRSFYSNRGYESHRVIFERRLDGDGED